MRFRNNVILLENPESSNIDFNFCHKSLVLLASLMCTYNDGSIVRINLALALASSAALAAVAACGFSCFMQSATPSRMSKFSTANAQSS
ncbi:unnamed protein product [Leptosia nina]|uniref:Uncharacterized protein n=1 Tax=Leptosia nina TaxID=320188 RepID=A0AAV1JMM6_9NEOP